MTSIRTTGPPLTILLTGRQGQIGWELCRSLAPLGKVIALDYPQIDYAHPESLRSLLREIRPNIIVSAAAYTAVDKAQEEKALAMTINAEAVDVLAREAKRLNALVVHYSTDYVFDGTKPGPYREDDAPCPLNAYGASKLAGDINLRESGCACLIFRTSWVYGVRGNNFLLTMLKLGRDRDNLRVIDDQIGAPTWSRLVAQASTLALAKLAASREKGWDESCLGIYNMTSAGSTSWYGFAREIFQKAAAAGWCPLPDIQAIASEDYPLPAARPRNSCLNNDKLFNVFGLALPSWEIALSLCMDELPCVLP
ncbi:MAG: dTDP-4-dehydrorhamnose reductase [Smithellaceae bacterium]|nr:dTDP-4-dehydrorhamnose reductase [Smithellaceae bacterium]